MATIKFLNSTNKPSRILEEVGLFTERLEPLIAVHKAVPITIVMHTNGTIEICTPTTDLLLLRGALMLATNHVNKALHDSKMCPECNAGVPHKEQN